MIPFAVLVVVSGVAFALGALGVHALAGWVAPLRLGLAAMLALTASAHFGRRRADLVRMVPESFPRPELLVTLTGVTELCGAVGLLIAPTARWAAFALAAQMLAMFPANVSAARRKLTIGGRPVTALGPRTLMQVVFVGAALAIGVGAR